MDGLILFSSQLCGRELITFVTVLIFPHYKPPNHLERSVSLPWSVMCAMMILQMSYELVFTGYSFPSGMSCFLLL